MEDANDIKSVKVKCSFCGKEMEYHGDVPEKSKKRMCYDCFDSIQPSEEEMKNLHVDIPTDKLPEVFAKGMAERMVEEVFPGLWSEGKETLKEMSKKELATQMFGTGIYLGVKTFMESTKKDGGDESGQDGDDDVMEDETPTGPQAILGGGASK